MSREIENLLLSLYDCKDDREYTYLTRQLFKTIPPGHHPLKYVEGIKSPPVRWALREHLFPSLSDLKIRYDLKALLTPKLEGEEEPSLEMGAFLIARSAEDYDVSPEDLSNRLDELAKPLARALQYSEDPATKMNLFRYYVFDKLKFRGNVADYYDPSNSFITFLLRTGKGIPVTISVLCILLARRVNLPVYGINMPGHFLLKFQGEEESWYMDPFNCGNLLTESECLHFLARQNLTPDPAHLRTADSITILKRMYRNLIHIHSSRGNREAEKQLRRHLSILENAGAAS